MRTALIVSALVHLCILLAAIISLPTQGFETEPLVALPIELLTVAEATDITEGRVDETKREANAAPETVERETPPAPEAMPGANDQKAEEIAVDDKAQARGPLSTSPVPEAAPPEVQETPLPDPAATEPAPAEPQVEETPPETKVAAVEAPPPEPPVEAAQPDPVPPEPEEQAQQAKPQPEPEPKQAEAPKLPETVVPKKRPKPPPKRERPKETEVAAAERPKNPDAFNADRISDLLNRTNPAGGGAGAAQAAIGVAGGKPNAALTVSEADSLRQQIYRCWFLPPGITDEDFVRFQIVMELGQDGSVVDVGPPTLVSGGRFFDLATESAIRAVRGCGPYKLPAEKYDSWKEVAITFDTRLDPRRNAGFGGTY